MFDYDNSKLDYSHAEDIAGLIGQYIHGNEPSHHVAYLYDYAGAPWRTQERLKQIVDSQYKPTPDGLSGNDDLGTDVGVARVHRRSVSIPGYTGEQPVCHRAPLCGPGGDDASRTAERFTVMQRRGCRMRIATYRAGDAQRSTI